VLHEIVSADAGIDPVQEAQVLAASAGTLEKLRAALGGYAHCEFKRGARNLVFCDGNPKARVMIIGEAPGRDEDREGRPFIGRAGQLLDKMLAAIDLGRDQSAPEDSVYIANIIPWRPPQNREPTPAEIAMMMPFVNRHVDLVAPDFLVLMGNVSCHALLGKRGITRLRGEWHEVRGRPAIPMLHPAYLLRQGSAKRAAWADLLALSARLKGK
jgi:DNA polymerase